MHAGAKSPRTVDNEEPLPNLFTMEYDESGVLYCCGLGNAAPDGGTYSEGGK